MFKIGMIAASAEFDFFWGAMPMKVPGSSAMGVAFAVLCMTNAALAGPAVNSYVFAYTSFFGPKELILNGATVLDATSSGWWNSNGTQFPNNANYIAGNCLPATCDAGDGKTIYNDYFVFDLSGVSGPITSATLSIANPSAADNLDPGFPSDGFGGTPTTYSNFDVSTPIATLIAPGTGTGKGIFIDLGSGIFYGATPVGPSSNGTMVDVDLDAAAIAVIENAEGSQFAIGGTLGFGDTVPEPVSISLFGAGLVGVASMRRRRKAAV